MPRKWTLAAVGAAAACAVVLAVLLVSSLSAPARQVRTSLAAEPGRSGPAPTPPLPVPASPSAPPSTPTPGAGGYLPGAAVPAGALATCQRFVSASPAGQRHALVAALAARLPAGALFPAGTTLAMDPLSWHQAGKFANATGTLTVPGRAAQHVEIGFVEQATGTWLIAFEEAVP